MVSSGSGRPRKPSSGFLWFHRCSGGQKNHHRGFGGLIVPPAGQKNRHQESSNFCSHPEVCDNAIPEFLQTSRSLCHPAAISTRHVNILVGKFCDRDPLFRGHNFRNGLIATNNSATNFARRRKVMYGSAKLQPTDSACVCDQIMVRRRRL